MSLHLGWTANDQELKDKFRALADKQERSTAWLARKLIQEYVEKEGLIGQSQASGLLEQVIERIPEQQ